MEKRTAKMIFNRSGGTASKGSFTNRVTIPTLWVKKLGITHDDRAVEIEFDEAKKEIRIKKCTEQ